MGFTFHARKTKQADGSYGYPENPTYDAIGRDGSTAAPGDTIEIEKKSGDTVERVVKRELHQFKSGDTVYELWPYGEEPGVTRTEHQALRNRVEALEATVAELVGKQVAEGAPY